MWRLYTTLVILALCVALKSTTENVTLQTRTHTMSDEKKHSHPPEQPCPTCGFNRHVLITKPTVSSSVKKATPKRKKEEGVDGLDPAPTADSKKAPKKRAEESVDTGMDPIQSADLCKQAEKPLTPKAVHEWHVACLNRCFVKKRDAERFSRSLVKQLGFFELQKASLCKLMAVTAPGNIKMTRKVAERVLTLLGDPDARKKRFEKKKKKAPAH